MVVAGQTVVKIIEEGSEESLEQTGGRAVAQRLLAFLTNLSFPLS